MSAYAQVVTDAQTSCKPPRLAKWRPHCKRDTWHDADDCYELAKNKEKRPKNWKSVFDAGNWEGGDTPAIISSSANLTVELQSQSDCLVANTDNSK